jgi:hypothetical protein
VTKIVVNPADLRRGAGKCKDTSHGLGLLAGRLRGKHMPEMPPGVRDRVFLEVSEVACLLGSEPHPLIAASEELRTRALWAEIADRLESGAELSDAQMAEFVALAQTGALTRYASPEQAELAGRFVAEMFEDTYKEPDQLIRLAGILRANEASGDFAVGFVEEFGAERMLDIPRVIQAIEYSGAIAAQHPGGSEIEGDLAYRLWSEGYRFEGDPVDDLLLPFSMALAVATSTNRLDYDVEHDIAHGYDQWSVAQLLYASTRDDVKFGTTFLVETFQAGLLDRAQELIAGEGPFGDGITPDEMLALGHSWDDGPNVPTDTKVLILNALADNGEAASIALRMPIGPLELYHPEQPGIVTKPTDLLLNYFDYDDDGEALGKTFIAATDYLQDAANDPSLTEGGRFAVNYRVGAAELTQVLTDYVLENGADEMPPITRALAFDLAAHHLTSLHDSAAGPYTASDAGLPGVIREDGALALRYDELVSVLKAISEDEAANDTFLSGVANYQSHLVDQAAAGHPVTGDWAHALGSFDGALLTAHEVRDMEQYGERLAQHERVFSVISGAVGLAKVHPVAGFVLDQGIDIIGDEWPGKPSEDAVREETYDQKVRMEKALKVMLATSFFENGRIDTPPPASLLDDGHLRPYNDLSANEQLTFDDWVRDHAWGEIKDAHGEAVDGLYLLDRDS